MSDKPELNHQPESMEEQYIPSPVSRRIWAWMGIVYMIILMILITYWIAKTQFMTNLTGIMLFPLLGALSAQGFNNVRLCRKGERSGNVPLLAATAIVMGIIALTTLAFGILQLITALGG